MIKVDIAEIEKLTDILVKLASDSDEALSRLRQVSNEMYNDVELPTYPQSSVALEAVSTAIDALNRANDTVQSLKNTVLPIASIYQENEQKNRNALNRISALMDNASTGFNAAIVSNGIAHVEHTDSIISQGKVQQLVADSVEEMKVANIAAISKTVSEEYEVNKIKDLVDES